MAVTNLKPSLSRSNVPPAPDHLLGPERELWDKIVAAFSFTDPASIALLGVACDCHMRARTAREDIEKTGTTFKDRWGQLRPNPLLNVERDSKSSFIIAMS